MEDNIERSPFAEWLKNRDEDMYKLHRDLLEGCGCKKQSKKSKKHFFDEPITGKTLAAGGGTGK